LFYFILFFALNHKVVDAHETHGGFFHYQQTPLLRELFSKSFKGETKIYRKLLRSFSKIKIMAEALLLSENFNEGFYLFI
jgi:hypothetical protein